MTKRTSKQPNVQGRGRGRPRRSDSFRVMPLMHEQLDPRKLGRAIVALVLHQSADRGEAKKRVETGDETS